MVSALDEQREDRPAYVRFERVPVEDIAATLEAGHFVAKDVDYALITPPYSKDVMKYKVKAWFDILEQDFRNGRLPESWLVNYKKAYEMFKNGQEMPLNGTAIRGWGIISPAQQETLIKMNVLTVEDLASMNDEGLKRIGMGSIELKNKAKNWLLNLKDNGALVVQMADLQKKFANQEALIGRQTEVMEEMTRRLAMYETEENRSAKVVPIVTESIGVDDILDDDEDAVKVARKKG